MNWKPDGLVIIQDREDLLNDTITALESNKAIMARLKRFYIDLIEDIDWSQLESDATKAEEAKEKAIRNVKDFNSSLDEYIYDSEMQIHRAKLAMQLAKDRKEIVSDFIYRQESSWLSRCL